MGIQGLLPFITDPQRGAIKTVSIRDFKGQTAAIDGYVLLHRGAFSCAKQLFEGQNTDAFVSHCMRYIDLLQKHGVRPLLVFDGASLSAKRDTERQRRDARKTARTQAVELLALGKTNDAYQAMSRAIDVTHKMALRFIHAARSRGIDSIVAPYEADAQLAYLTHTGLAHFVITEDSDLIVFGCEKILFKLQLNGEGRLYDKSLLEGALCTKKLRCNNYSFEKFRIACILSGCDYAKSLPGIGLAKAWKFASITDSLEDLNFKLPKMGQYLNMNGLDVNDEYIRLVKIANGAFKHQIVYDPVERRRRPLEDFHEDNASCVITTETVGQIKMNEDESFDRALGNIDPMSGAQLDNYRPSDNTFNKSSIWNRNRLTQSTLTASVVSTRNSIKASVSVATPPKDVTAVTTQELEAQDTRLTNLLQQYTKTDTKMSSTVKECYYKELYEGQNDDNKEGKTDFNAEILAKNPFIKKKQVPVEESSIAKVLHNEDKMEEITEKITPKSDDSKNSPTAKKSTSPWSKLQSIFNNHKRNEKCPFKKQRNNKYDQLVVQKRKAGENGYFCNTNNKKSKLEGTNTNQQDSTTNQFSEESNLCQDTDLSGKENYYPQENELITDAPLAMCCNDTLDLEQSTDTKSDIILKEINVNVEHFSSNDLGASESEEMKNIDVLNLNLDNFPDKALVNKEIETLCQDVDTISVHSDELLPIDQMLECILATNDDDAEIAIVEQNSPIIRRHKKGNVVSSAGKAGSSSGKGKRQTNLLDFFKKK